MNQPMLYFAYGSTPVSGADGTTLKSREGYLPDTQVAFDAEGTPFLRPKRGSVVCGRLYDDPDKTQLPGGSMGVVLTPDGCMHQAEIAELSGAPEEGVTMEVATLFVYGTLMRGECRFSILEHDCGLEALCEGAVRGRLLSLGAYPGVVALSTAKSWVHGEFCMLREPNKAFKVLDEVEDFLGWNDPSSMYERVLAKVRMPDGSTPLAWTYRLAIPWKLLPEISGGDWRRRAR